MNLITQTEEKYSLLICQSDKTGNYMRFSTEMSKLHEISAYSPLLFKSHEGESGASKLIQSSCKFLQNQLCFHTIQPRDIENKFSWNDKLLASVDGIPCNTISLFDFINWYLDISWKQIYQLKAKTKLPNRNSSMVSLRTGCKSSVKQRKRIYWGMQTWLLWLGSSELHHIWILTFC
jgi:hypothetical protein